MGIEQLIATQAQRTSGPSPMQQLSNLQSLKGQQLNNQGQELRNTAGIEALDQDKRQRGLEYAANVGQQIKREQDPQKKAQIYSSALQFAKMNGHDIQAFPQQYDDRAQMMLDVAHGQVYGGKEFDALLKGAGISLNQKEFNNHVEQLRPTIGADGNIDPTKLTVAQRASAIELGLLPRATGSAAITAATTEGLTDKVASSQQKIKTHERFGADSGKNAAKYDDLAGAWDVNREFIMDSIPELKEAFSGAPGSSISKGIQSALSKVVGNTSGADAQALIEQYGAIFLQGMPFPPGAQSDKEMQARAQTLSDQLTNPNVSADMKIKLIANFVEWQDKKAKNYRAKSGQIMGGADPAAPTNPATPTVSQFHDGQTATNPNTGEKIIFRGGRWQPL